MELVILMLVSNVLCVYIISITVYNAIKMPMLKESFVYFFVVFISPCKSPLIAQIKIIRIFNGERRCNYKYQFKCLWNTCSSFNAEIVTCV